MMTVQGNTRAHWITTVLLTVCTLCVCNIQNGGVITEDTIIRRYESPLLIKNDILVAPEVTLTVEPGVELRFAPSVMLAVNGTLIAKVHQIYYN